MACLPSPQDETAERKVIRGVEYRKHLDGLTDDLWHRTVDLAIEREQWWPIPVARLLQYASEAATVPSVNAGLLPEAKVSREDFQRGFEVVRRELIRMGLIDPEDQPVKEMPS